MQGKQDEDNTTTAFPHSQLLLSDSRLIPVLTHAPQFWNMFEARYRTPAQVRQDEGKEGKVATQKVLLFNCFLYTFLFDHFPHFLSFKSKPSLFSVNSYG